MNDFGQNDIFHIIICCSSASVFTSQCVVQNEFLESKALEVGLIKCKVCDLQLPIRKLNVEWNRPPHTIYWLHLVKSWIFSFWKIMGPSLAILRWILIDEWFLLSMKFLNSIATWFEFVGKINWITLVRNVTELSINLMDKVSVCFRNVRSRDLPFLDCPNFCNVSHKNYRKFAKRQ